MPQNDDERAFIAHSSRPELSAADTPVSITPRYVMTAAFLSFTTAALASYPSAAVVVEPGTAPKAGLWFLFTFVLGVLLSVYSAMKRPAALISANAVVVPFICFLFLVVCWMLNPIPVQANLSVMAMFTFFTFGSTLWLPLLAFALHVWASPGLGRLSIP